MTRRWALGLTALALGACDARGFWGDRFLTDPSAPCGAGGECSACRSDGDCRDQSPVCDRAAGRCRGCASNDECPSGVCVPEVWPGFCMTFDVIAAVLVAWVMLARIQRAPERRARLSLRHGELP